MSLASDITHFLDSGTSTLTMGTNLFVAEEPVDSPDTCAIVIGSPGSYDTESGLEKRSIQVVVKAKSYIIAETLATTIFDLLKNKTGFSSIANIFYCEVLSAPYPIDRDIRGRIIFSINFLISKVTP